MVSIREYQPEDLSHVLDVFEQAVFATTEYTRAQQQAWAFSAQDTARWKQKLQRYYTLVATQETTITGFGSIDSTGYIDFLFVLPSFQNQGVGSLLYDGLESWAKQNELPVISLDSSLDAAAFFRSKGLRKVKEQEIWRQEEQLKNIIMNKPLSDQF